MNTEQKRPTVALVLGIICIVWGIVGICGGIYGLVSQSMFANAANGPNIPGDVQGILRIIQGIGFVLSVALIVAGIGLILVKNWARILAMIYAAIHIPLAVVSASLAPKLMKAVMEQSPQGANIPPGMVETIATFAAVGGACCGLIYPLVLLIVLNLKSVRVAFTGRASAPPPLNPQ